MFYVLGSYYFYHKKDIESICFFQPLIDRWKSWILGMQILCQCFPFQRQEGKMLLNYILCIAQTLKFYARNPLGFVESTSVSIYNATSNGFSRQHWILQWALFFQWNVLVKEFSWYVTTCVSTYWEDFLFLLLSWIKVAPRKPQRVFLLCQIEWVSHLQMDLGHPWDKWNSISTFSIMCLLKSLLTFSSRPLVWEFVPMRMHCK